jgi:hypothetical protein
MASTAAKSTFDLRNKVKDMSTRARLTGYTRFLLLELALIQGKNDCSWCKNETLRRTLGAGKNEVKICLDRLIKLGLISQKDRGGRIKTTVVESAVDAWIALDSTTRASKGEVEEDSPISVDLVEESDEVISVDHDDEAITNFEPDEQPVVQTSGKLGETATETCNRYLRDGFPVAPETERADAVQLLTLLYNYCNRPTWTSSKIMEQADTLAPLCKRANFERVRDVLAWVFEIPAACVKVAWTTIIAGQSDPAAYFVLQFGKNLERNYLAWTKAQMKAIPTATTAKPAVGASAEPGLTDKEKWNLGNDQFERDNGYRMAEYQQIDQVA